MTVCDGGKCVLWGKVGETCGMMSGGINACLERNLIPTGSTVGTCEASYAVGHDCKKTTECVPGAACDNTTSGKCVACSK